jgi:adenylate cyclase
VQDDVTTHIVSALALNLNAGDRRSIAAEQTDNLEAYDSFLRGRELWFQTTKEANREAATLLRRAIELDPRFAPAYAFLGGSYVIDYANGWSASPAQALEEAEKAARHAVHLDEHQPYALWALALVYDLAGGDAAGRAASRRTGCRRADGGRGHRDAPRAAAGHRSERAADFAPGDPRHATGGRPLRRPRRR